MSLFDCRFLSAPSFNRSSSEKPCTIECCDSFDSPNQHSESPNDSSGSYGLQEVSAPPFPISSAQKATEKKLQRAVYSGPDVFGKVLGPTADESILVGLQALMDMAGSLEFTSSTPTAGAPATSLDSSNVSSSRESAEVSSAVGQSSASCQCCDGHCSFMSPEILTQENIAASVNNKGKSKCQYSQTRVLPTSMTHYNSEKTEEYGNFNVNMVSSPNSTSPKFQTSCHQNELKSVSPPKKESPSYTSSPNSRPTSPPCQCSKFYHQMTTISVLENSPQPSPTYVCCKPQSETSSTPLQTLPQQSSSIYDVKEETDSVASQGRISVACDCNFCIPISAGVSEPLSGESTSSKSRSGVEVVEKTNKQYMCYTCCRPKGRGDRTKHGKEMPDSRNKSCVCSLIPKGIIVADVACSCLKVNTSCQYCKSESPVIESKSTQCKSSHRRFSGTQVCSESGDFKPYRKRSVRILSGPYECPDISETRCSMESKKSMSRSMVALRECNDDPTKFCFQKPTRICMEMGDSCIPPPMEIRYAITKITKFPDFSTFEVMKSTSKKPKCMPKAVEGVFVLKKDENYCTSKTC